jgi:hypothetical protein
MKPVHSPSGRTHGFIEMDSATKSWHLSIGGSGVKGIAVRVGDDPTFRSMSPTGQDHFTLDIPFDAVAGGWDKARNGTTFTVQASDDGLFIVK